MKKENIIKLIIVGLTTLSIIILSIVKANPDAADYYTKHFACAYIQWIGDFTKIVPFSIFEIGFFLLIGLLLFLIIRIFTGIKKKRLTWLSRLLTLITVCMCIINLYYGTTSVAYGRSEVDIPHLNNEDIDETLIENALSYYIDDYNTLSSKFERDENGLVISPYNVEELSSKLNDEYKLLQEQTDYFSSYEPLAKPLLISGLFSEFHLTGITMSITGETNYNNWISSTEAPFTIGHEFAHAKGVYKEDDANLTSLYILLNSKDDYLRYCGLYVGIGSVIDAYQTTYHTSYSIKYPLNNTIKKEWSTISTFWKEHDAMSDFATWWNDLYLKINGTSGTDSYSDVSTKEDTGKTDDEGNKIYKITSFSPYQKMMYYLYENKA